MAIQTKSKFARALSLALISSSFLTSGPVSAEEAQPLEEAFKDPPNAARPRVWWHWMNGNISKEGIAKDLAWMKRVGIGGLQNFDANLRTPTIVDKRLVYMTPEWKDAFRFAAQEADRHGLELAIAASPGWSETGGPWVKPGDGLKKLVWTETDVVGGTPFKGKLAPPPVVTGPFQSIAKPASIDDMTAGKGPKNPKYSHGADVAVLAWPLQASALSAPAKALANDGKAVDLALLSDADINSAVTFKNGSGANTPTLTYSYAKPQSVSSASLFMPGASAMFFGAIVKPHLEASDDGQTWRKVADMPVSQVPTTVSFAPTTARHFRLVMTPKANESAAFFAPAPGVDMAGIGAGFASMAAVGGSGLKVADFRLYGEARIDRYEAKAGFSIEQDYYALSKGVPDTGGIDPAKVINLTSKLRADGSLDWTPPKGNWRVVRMGYSLLGTENHPAPPEATGLEVDKFDGPAVRRYMEHYIGMYKDASGGLLGKRGVQAILTDSIEVGAANWTPKMVEQFTKLRGYDPTPWMPTLTGTIIGSRAQSDKFLYDYRRTLADLMASEHYGTVASVAHEHGLKVYGEALEDKRPSLGDDMAMRRHADIPMAAMWTYERKVGPRVTLLADMKGAASVAHVYGQNITAAESLTSSMSPWIHSPGNLKRIIDQEFANGINRPVIHTSVHQPRDDKFPGLSLFIFGQYFNRHEAWAEMAKPWVDYLSRNSLMLQAGRNVADVAYFYGEEAPLTAIYGEKVIADAPTSHAYDFVNANALFDALSNEGAEVVSVGGARYRVIYLGGTSRKMTLPTLKRLAALVEGGATLIGKAPEGNPSLAGADSEFSSLVARLWPGSGDAKVGNGRVVVADNADRGLVAIGVKPDAWIVPATSGDLASRADFPFVHRKLADGGDAYFIVNRRDNPALVNAKFRVNGKQAELWDPVTGKITPIESSDEGDVTRVLLNLVAEDAKFIVFRKARSSEARRQPSPNAASAAASAAAAAKAAAAQPEAVINGSWTINFQADRGAPASATFLNLQPLNEHSDPGIKYFSGIATYHTSFVAPSWWKKGQPLWLDLGKVSELAEVSVNGKAAGGAWHAPFRVDIGNATKPGKNKLEVRVANLWVNRLIGDAQPGAQKITFTAMPTFRADAPLRPSGLIGPVTLMGQGR